MPNKHEDLQAELEAEIKKDYAKKAERRKQNAPGKNSNMGSKFAAKRDWRQQQKR